MELHAATDVIDDFGRAGKFFVKRHIDQLMDIMAELGVSSHEWVINETTRLYLDYPEGFDLLGYAAEAAHRNGIALHAVFKPFEAVPHYGPHTAPHPKECSWSDLYGVLMPIQPFVAAHPEFCMKRRAEPLDRPGPLAAIRLVKGDAAPCAIEARHLSVWTSDRLGAWERWPGDFELRQSVERRLVSTRTRDCRILTLSGLDIAESQRYVEVRLSEDCPENDFANHPSAFVELVGSDGSLLPSTPGSGRSLSADRFKRRAADPVLSRINPCLDDPEFAEFVKSKDIDRHWREARDIGWPWRVNARVPFHEERRATVARGLNERLPILHPCYPEVRANWLGTIRGLLDCGVDGVNVRCSSHYHFRSTDPQDYGYNEPVLEALPNPENRAAVAKANGDALTGFMREVRTLVGEYGKQLGVHVLAPAFHDREEEGGQLDFALVDWQWREWVREIADYVEFRGMMGFRDTSARLMVERVALECRNAGKPFILQGNRRVVGYNAPLDDWRREVQWAAEHPDITAYQLYETANFTRINEEDDVECSPAVREMLSECLAR